MADAAPGKTKPACLAEAGFLTRTRLIAYQHCGKHFGSDISCVVSGTFCKGPFRAVTEELVTAGLENPPNCAVETATMAANSAIAFIVSGPVHLSFNDGDG